MPPLTVQPEVRQQFQEANPPEWLRIAAPLLSMVAPGPTGAALTMVPQPQPESTLGQYSQYAPLALLIPALMGKAAGSRTFGQPLMDQMRRMYVSRRVARTGPGELSTPLADELGGMQERVRDRGSYGQEYRAREATPGNIHAAFRQQMPGNFDRPPGLKPGEMPPQAYEVTPVPYNYRTPADPLGYTPWGEMPGVTPRDPQLGTNPANRRFTVIPDRATDSFAVVEQYGPKEGPMPLEMADPLDRAGTFPVSRHKTMGEALEAANYYTMRNNQAYENLRSGERPLSFTSRRQSGRYAPVGMHPSERHQSFRQMFPWLTENWFQE